jgi:GTP cyclohydrolase III
MTNNDTNATPAATPAATTTPTASHYTAITHIETGMVIGTGRTPSRAWREAIRSLREASIMMDRARYCETAYDPAVTEPRVSGGIVLLCDKAVR